MISFYGWFFPYKLGSKYEEKIWYFLEIKSGFLHSEQKWCHNKNTGSRNWTRAFWVTSHLLIPLSYRAIDGDIVSVTKLDKLYKFLDLEIDTFSIKFLEYIPK